MRLHALPDVHVEINKFGLLLFLALAVCVVSIPARAQVGTWQVDSEYSVARLSLGSGANSLETGVARISGDVVFDASDPSDPVVTLNISPGLQRSNPQISFTSKRSAMTADGRLIVTGELSVTRVERSVTIEPSEAYRGAEYGPPVFHTDSHEVSLVFSDPRQPAGHSGKMELSASTSISREAFPQMLAVLDPGNWPTTLANDEKCNMPPTISEDYSGATCTGTVIATVTNNQMMIGNGGGPDYRGFEPAIVPNRNFGTMALDLKLTQSAPATSITAKKQPAH